MVQDFHLRVARRALRIGQDDGPAPEAFDFDPEVGACEWRPDPCPYLEEGFHVGFLRRLMRWLQGLEWAVSTTDGY